MVTMSMVGSDNLYELTVNDSWMKVERGEGFSIYAYVNSNSNMCILDLDETMTTPALTTQITMKSISNAVYADLEDINVSVDSYAIGTDEAIDLYNILI